MKESRDIISFYPQLPNKCIAWILLGLNKSTNFCAGATSSFHENLSRGFFLYIFWRHF
jgi:hypothetical protein